VSPVLLVIAGPNGAGKNGELRRVYGPLPEWVADAVDSLPRSADFVDLRVA